MRVEGQNKAIFQQLHEAMERDGFAARADFFAERTISYGIPATREMIRAVLKDISDTFPGAKMEPINMVVEGEWVVGRYTFSGTHTGVGQHPFVHGRLLTGVPPTGKSVRHIHMFRLKDSQIIEHHANRDDIKMMRQLGLHPPTAPPGLN